jgi:RNA polymerase sigma factor (sigma-70 family)
MEAVLMIDHTINDQELVRQFIHGDHSALEILINRHQRRLFSYILLTVKDRQEAEDIFQDTFIKVINTLRNGNYNEEGKFLPWMMRIAHNLMIDYFRREKRMPMVEKSSEYDFFETLKLYEQNVEDRIITTQIHNDVRALIEYLPEEQKQVLMMRHYAGMSFKDIAESTNVSINTALGRMRYAILNLRKLVDEKDIILSV